jgi:hypothetical protein
VTVKAGGRTDVVTWDRAGTATVTAAGKPTLP